MPNKRARRSRFLQLSSSCRHHGARSCAVIGPCEHGIVVDIVMKPVRTRLLETAATAGKRTHAGMHMLAPQIDMYASFFGVR